MEADYRPMRPREADALPRGKHFDFEIKFDGLRCGLAIDSRGMRLIGADGAILTGWFPELTPVSSDISGREMLIDGEVIAGDGSIESFEVLARRARRRGRPTHNVLPVSFVAFDLLWHEGTSWMSRPLTERRSHLRSVVTETARIAVSRSYSDGPSLLAIAATRGLEGVVAKDRRSAYVLGGESASWIVTDVAADPLRTAASARNALCSTEAVENL